MTSTVLGAAKAISLVYRVYSSLESALVKHEQAKMEEWLEAIMAAYRNGTSSHEEFEREIDDRINGDIKSRDATLKILKQSYRALLDSVDDRILPSLAKLTAMYLEKIGADTIHIVAPVDYFFRRTCRLLMDLSYQDYQFLQRLIIESNQIVSEEVGFSKEDRFEIQQINGKIGILRPEKRITSYSEDNFCWLTNSIDSWQLLFAALKELKFCLLYTSPSPRD